MAAINQPQPTTGLDLHDRLHAILPESALRLLFERSPDPILLIDGEVFVDCNQAAVEMLRYASKIDLLSARPSDLSRCCAQAVRAIGGPRVCASGRRKLVRS
jgi:PAS domain-containing protein